MQSISISNTQIRQIENLYSLNDLHVASGSNSKHQPAFFIRLDQTQALISEIANQTTLRSANVQILKTIRGKGKNQGTYACKELVYAYAMWISPAFMLEVIRAYDKQVTRQTISPEQKAELIELVHQKAANDHSAIATIWIRHNRHYRINSYHELLARNFEDAKQYIMNLEIKPKAIANPFPNLEAGRYLVVVDQHGGQYVRNINGMSLINSSEVLKLQDDYKIVSMIMDRFMHKLSAAHGIICPEELEVPLLQ